MEFVLLHSPLVGPTTWRWVAGALVDAGHAVALPDLRDAAVTGDRDGLITAAAAVVPAPWTAPILVGHSGAGSLLPSVAERLGTSSGRLVFVDAGLPPCEGSATPGGDFLDRLRALAVGDVLPRWSTWWGDDAMTMLVPDDDRRRELEAEMPQIPLPYFESPFEVPGGWCESPGSFLLLSESYRGDAERSRALGWPTVERLGGHLDIVNDPDGVARAIVELVD
jgi:pimeloyl-ACP methyl ester carboxylesterase